MDNNQERDLISYVVTPNKPTTREINDAAVAIVQSYLEYTGGIISSVLSKQAYNTAFKDINDDLVLKPDELIEFIDQVQRALASTDD
jgi:hypothetical protein